MIALLRLQAPQLACPLFGPLIGGCLCRVPGADQVLAPLSGPHITGANKVAIDVPFTRLFLCNDLRVIEVRHCLDSGREKAKIIQKSIAVRARSVNLGTLSVGMWGNNEFRGQRR